MKFVFISDVRECCNIKMEISSKVEINKQRFIGSQNVGLLKI